MGSLGGVISKRGLPITKEGKAHGKHAIEDVCERLMDAGKIALTDDRDGKRYEPVIS